MSRSTLSCSLLAVLSLAAAGCDATVTDKGPEEDVPADGKLDWFQRPTDHGAIAFAAPVDASLTATAKHHTWTFSLAGDARVHLYTHPALTSRSNTDTVLYLYKRKADGSWGSYLVRNDDDATTVERATAGRGGVRPSVAMGAADGARKYVPCVMLGQVRPYVSARILRGRDQAH